MRYDYVTTSPKKIRTPHPCNRQRTDVLTVAYPRPDREEQFAQIGWSRAADEAFLKIPTRCEGVLHKHHWR